MEQNANEDPAICVNEEMDGFRNSTGVLFPYVSFQVAGVCVDFPTVYITKTGLAGRTS